MKNLFLFLLFTSFTFGQITPVNKLRITGNVTDNVATKINVQDAVGNVNTIAKIDLQDVLTFTNEASFPTTGIAGKLYVATSSPTKLYRWNGTIYNEVGGVANATTTVKGIVKLAGDLSGTADLPTVPNKVDKVAGQGLISDAEKTRLSTVVNFDNSGNAAALNQKLSLTGGTLTGNITAPKFLGRASNSETVYVFDSDRTLANRLPNSSPQNIVFDFANASSLGASGRYAGVMTFIPYDGQTVSTGDSSYQLAFVNETGINGSGLPGLKLRKGIDTTWGQFYTLLHSGNISNYLNDTTLTGIPTAPTPSVGTNTNQIATTAFVNQTISAPVSGTLSGIVNNVSLQELGGVDKSINDVRIGRGAGNVSTNTAVGAFTLFNNTTGFSNVANGDRSLFSNTIGFSNTSSGNFALFNNTIGKNNTSVGYSSFSNNIDGNNNTGVGSVCGQNLSSGTGNTFIGFATGQNIINGNYNTFVGASNNSLGDVSNTIVLSAGNSNRIIVNSSGKTILLGRLKAIIPAYATDAAADADSGLESGDFYKITGLRTVMQKP